MGSDYADVICHFRVNNTNYTTAQVAVFSQINDHPDYTMGSGGRSATYAVNPRTIYYSFVPAYTGYMEANTPYTVRDTIYDLDSFTVLSNSATAPFTAN